MTQFTPYENNPNDPSYLGYSKEPGSIKYHSVLGTAADALGDVGSAAIKTADTLTKITADDELEDKLYKTRAEDTRVGKELLLDTKSALGLSTGAAKGASLETTGQGDSDTPAPPPVSIDQGIQRIQKLEQALKMGKGSDVAYSGETASIVQNLISRFPGYREYIVGKATTILGGNPFNQERNAIQASLLQLYNQRNTVEKDWNTYVTAHGQFMNPTLFKAASEAKTEQQRWDIRARVADIQHDDFLTKKLDATLRAKAAAGKLTEDDMQGHIDNLGSRIQNKVFKEIQFTASGFTGSGQDMLNVVMKAHQEGVPPDPMVLKAVAGIFTQAEAEFNRAWDAEINSPNYIPNKDSGNLERAKEGEKGQVSLSSLRRNTEALEAIRNKYLLPMRMIKDQVGQGYLNWATVSAATVSTVGDNVSAQMVAIPIFAKYKGLEKLLGPAAQAFFNSAEFMNGWKGLSDGARALNQLNVMDTISGATANPNLYDNIIKRARDLNPNTRADAATGVPNMTSAEIRTSVDTFKKIFTSKEITMDDKLKAGRILANSGTADFVGHFNSVERFNVWSDIYSPEVSAEMKKSSPELWQQYKTTGNNIFKRLFNEWIDTANKHVKEQDKFDQMQVKWSQDTQQFDYKPTTAVPPLNDQTGIYTRNFQRRTGAETAIDRLNAGLRVVNGYLSQEGQKITPEWLKQTGINIGVDTEDKLSRKILQELRDIKTEDGKDKKTPKIFQKNSSLEDLQKVAVTGHDGQQYLQQDGQWYRIKTTTA